MAETAWSRTKRYSGTAYTKALKPGFDKAWKALDKLGAPINRLSNKVGAEAFWPTTLDKESDKAARILRSFCKDGFYDKVDAAQANAAEEVTVNGDGKEKVIGPQGKQRVVKKIPKHVIKNAVGLAIFTTMRTGLWISGAGGSGVLIARNKETNEWGSPSGILLHTAGLGFMVGVDIYDCVLVINTYEALEAFTKIRATLGAEVSVVAGPVGVGGVLESEIHKRQAPIFTYLKSRGFYAGVQVDGTVVIERNDENEVFYGEKIGVSDILAGKARNPPKDKYRMLTNTIKAAQGDEISDEELPAAGLAPGDFEIEAGNFGVPDIDDPDPYGVRALGDQGILIKTADTLEPASPKDFEFKPSPTSPVYAAFHRMSIGSHSRNGSGSWRHSTLSVESIDRGTQTDDVEVIIKKKTPPPLPPRGLSVVSIGSVYSESNAALTAQPEDSSIIGDKQEENTPITTIEPEPITTTVPADTETHAKEPESHQEHQPQQEPHQEPNQEHHQ
jgi:lipid-binding SYLF domain-containing protein